MRYLLFAFFGFIVSPVHAENPAAGLIKSHCLDCHTGPSAEAGLDLKAFKFHLVDEGNFDRWVKIYDRIKNREMPPADQPRPDAKELAKVTLSLQKSLIEADTARRQGNGRAVLRRLTRTEYENTIRDLLDLPGIALKDLLPADGEAHGFDKVGEALEISHVQLAKYMEAADQALEYAIATSPEPPEVYREQQYPAAQYSLKLVVLNGDAVLLKDKKPDAAVPLIGEKREQKLRWWEEQGVFPSQSAVGVFRHEDDAFRPRFRFAPIFPGRYRMRTSLWSFWWNKDHLEPAPKPEAAALYAGTRVIDYFDAPSLKSQVHEVELWMNPAEQVGFNAASLHPIRVSERRGRTLAYEGPGIAIDWIEFEGPIHETWPPESHRRLFGDLPLKSLDTRTTELRLPPRINLKSRRPIPGTLPYVPKLKPEERHLLWTPSSENPLEDARELLSAFLPRAFRRPVTDDEIQRFVEIVSDRLNQNETFEGAMRRAYKTALCDPRFLYHSEPTGKLDEYALASRLSYFLWGSMPDAKLNSLAAENKLSDPKMLYAQVERLLNDAKAERFRDDFLDQWLDLDRIEETTPDGQLYPEFSRYLKDCMVEESRAFFQEMLEQDESVLNVVDSPYGLLNQKLAELYDIPGIEGRTLRRVKWPDDSLRGGFLTQAAVLKITANGTTTSPVTRGAWVMDKILGTPPEPPPADVPAIEPDTRGTTTIREQLAAHRSQAICASCHRKIDPPGFALESFDVIGGWRERYRSVENGEKVDFQFPNGRGVRYRLGPSVDSSGVTPDGKPFAGIADYRKHLLENPDQIARNLTRQLLIYAAGAEVRFADRTEIDEIVSACRERNYGLRTMIHRIVESPLFQMK